MVKTKQLQMTTHISHMDNHVMLYQLSHHVGTENTALKEVFAAHILPLVI